MLLKPVLCRKRVSDFENFGIRTDIFKRNLFVFFFAFQNPNVLQKNNEFFFVNDRFYVGFCTVLLIVIIDLIKTRRYLINSEKNVTGF